VRKVATVLFLAVSLIWHAFAVADLGLLCHHGEGVAHAALHMEKEGHHHHDDGTFHQDDSDESLQHVYADGCANASGVLPAHVGCGAPDFAVATLHAASQAEHDPPVLEGPRRPPRLTA
jgi:hypothetical protein